LIIIDYHWYFYNWIIYIPALFINLKIKYIKTIEQQLHINEDDDEDELLSELSIYIKLRK
jgi:uncharacterized membrane protein YhdT